MTHGSSLRCKGIIGDGCGGDREFFMGALEILCQSDRILNSKGKTDEKNIRFGRST
jgi:hypothetical protein